eukprot:GHVS01068573.1.p1 GENE.GHVS01068573.1~~GHVS01068573.1.p1  ORF type:complete len:480 (+),score=67.02 GHVS01068573.1:25-1440(+)
MEVTQEAFVDCQQRQRSPRSFHEQESASYHCDVKTNVGGVSCLWREEELMRVCDGSSGRIRLGREEGKSEEGITDSGGGGIVIDELNGTNGEKRKGKKRGCLSFRLSGGSLRLWQKQRFQLLLVFVVCLGFLKKTNASRRNLLVVDLDNTLNDSDLKDKLEHELEKSQTVDESVVAKNIRVGEKTSEWLETKAAVSELVCGESCASEGLPVFVVTGQHLFRKHYGPIFERARKLFIADTFGVSEGSIAIVEDVGVELASVDAYQSNCAPPIKGYVIRKDAPIQGPWGPDVAEGQTPNRITRDVYVVSSADLGIPKPGLLLRAVEIGMGIADKLFDGEDAIRVITIGDDKADLIRREEDGRISWGGYDKHFVLMTTTAVNDMLNKNAPTAVVEKDLYVSKFKDRLRYLNFLIDRQALGNVCVHGMGGRIVIDHAGSARSSPKGEVSKRKDAPNTRRQVIAEFLDFFEGECAK